MATKPKGVKTEHPQYTAMRPIWQRCRDAAAGEAAVHTATEAYLPKLQDEKGAAYAARLVRTPYYNATWRTIVGMRGMLFREAPEVENVPFVDNIDSAGTTLEQFAQRLSLEVMTVGRVGVLADHPAGPTPGATVADMEAAGVRPSLQLYTAETVINWKTRRINNTKRLSLVVLAEHDDMPADEYDHTTEPRWRVLDLVDINGVPTYRQRVFKSDDKGNDIQIGTDIFPMQNGRTMEEIPFAFISADGLGPDVEIPPLVDLVDLNLHHYAVSADYEHGCHFSGLPTLFISGHTPQIAEPGQPSATIYIGGPSANALPNPDARAYFVETTGNFEALRRNLEDKRAMMAILGARMLEAQKLAAETSDTVAQNRKGEESVLASIGATISAGVTKLAGWLVGWSVTGTGEPKFALCADFAPSGLSAQELTAMVGAWQAGMPGFSDQNVFDQLQERGVVEPGVTFEEEQARIADKGPRIVAPAPAPQA